ncbi:solute carrier family 35 member D2-like protein [Babylonia areolata]|uniref:solute carrier family 35 member D2-like protein n=1 Tax=Babylonia areolata TaxID=304850 RepID=UPI003FD19BCB
MDKEREPKSHGPTDVFKSASPQSSVLAAAAAVVLTGVEAGGGGEGKEEEEEQQQQEQQPPPQQYSMAQRLATALCYAVSATVIVIVNKLVLTSYRFPSFLALGLGQMVVTVALLLSLRTMGVVRFPAPHKGLLKQIFPLPLLFFGSIVFSLGGTQRLSLPMVIALRKFANLFILIGEYFVLGVVATQFIQFTVFLMILGSLIAASHDLAFDLMGYSFIMATNLCSSMTGVFAKQKLNSKTLGKFGLMFYNCLFMMGPTFLLAMITGDLHKAATYDQWADPVFGVQFLAACTMGCVVNFCTLLCTQYNSALTTSIVGVLKNLFIIYAGMYIGGDYVFSTLNFVGINVSVVGALMYSYATFRSKQRKPVNANGSGVTTV